MQQFNTNWLVAFVPFVLNLYCVHFVACVCVCARARSTMSQKCNDPRFVNCTWKIMRTSTRRYLTCQSDSNTCMQCAFIHSLIGSFIFVSLHLTLEHFPVHTQLLTYWLYAINLRDTVAATTVAATTVAAAAAAQAKSKQPVNSIIPIDDSLFGWFSLFCSVPFSHAIFI